MVSRLTIVGDAFRRFATLAVLLALTIRAIVPVGMMPDLSRLAEGQFPLVICTGHGPETVFAEDSGIVAISGQQDPTKVPAGPSDHSADPCPFAAALSLLAPVLLVLLCALVRPAKRFFAVADYGTRFSSRSRDPWTARGPPPAFCS